MAKFAESTSVLKNSSMLLWSPDQELKDPLLAVCWPWFGSVEFIFDLPTSQIATFSTGWGVLRSSFAGSWIDLALRGVRMASEATDAA
jgi:hypothetical protein